MYQLQSLPEPHWLDVLPGVRVRFKYLGSVGMEVGRAAMSQLPEGSAQGERSYAFTIAVAQWGALEWEGVGDAEGAVLPLTPDRLASLMEAEVRAYDSIDAGYIIPAILRDAEKNGSSASQTGTSTAAKPTAKPARNSAKRAPRG